MDREPSLAGKLLLSGAAALAGLYLSQALVLALPSLKPPPRTLAQLARAKGLPYDERTALQVLAELRAKGEKVMPHGGATYIAGQDGIPSGGGRILPLAGISLTTVTHCNEFGVWQLYRTDEHGFNNPPGLYRPGKLDAAVIGDSFAQGSCVAQSESIAARMRAKGALAISLGTAGVGPLVELAALKEYAEPLRPKNVFWLYYASDPDDLAREKDSPTLMRYLEDPGFSQELMKRQPLIDGAWSAYLEKAMAAASLDHMVAAGENAPSPRLRRRIGRFMSLYYLRAFLAGAYPLNRSDRRNLELFQRILSEARRRVEGWGGKLHFVYLPERSAFTDRRRSDRFRGAVTAAARSEGLDIIDVTEAFARGQDPLSYFYLGSSTHYNAEGHAAAADAMLAALIPPGTKSNSTGR